MPGNTPFFPDVLLLRRDTGTARLGRRENEPDPTHHKTVTNRDLQRSKKQARASKSQHSNQRSNKEGKSLRGKPKLLAQDAHKGLGSAETTPPTYPVREGKLPTPKKVVMPKGLSSSWPDHSDTPPNAAQTRSAKPQNPKDRNISCRPRHPARQRRHHRCARQGSNHAPPYQNHDDPHHQSTRQGQQKHQDQENSPRPRTKPRTRASADRWPSACREVTRKAAVGKLMIQCTSLPAACSC